MSFERDGVVFRFTSEEAEAERQRIMGEQVLPAARAYFAAHPAVVRIYCCVAQYWNDEGLDDLYLNALASTGRDWKACLSSGDSADEVCEALGETVDVQSVYAAYCEYGDQNEPDSSNYRLFATIERSGELVVEPRVRPWLDGVKCLYEPDEDPSGDEEERFEAMIALGASAPTTPPASAGGGLVGWLKKLLN